MNILEWLFKEMPELNRLGVQRWISEREDILDWVIAHCEVRGVIGYDSERESWSAIIRAAKGVSGRPRMITDQVLDTIISRMGDKGWGARELSKACEDIASGASIRRGIDQLVKSGRIKKVVGGPGRKLSLFASDIPV